MSGYAQHLLEAIAAGIVFGFSICYAVGRWWPALDSETSAAATTAMTAAISALRASGTHVDWHVFAVDLSVCLGIGIIATIVLLIWCDRS